MVAIPILFMLLLVAASFIIWIYALIDTATRHFTDPNAKLIWILVIIFTHLIGAIIYLAIGRSQGSKAG